LPRSRELYKADITPIYYHNQISKVVQIKATQVLGQSLMLIKKKR
jgi:hypothetical protein